MFQFFPYLRLVADQSFEYSPILGSDNTKNAENNISVSEHESTARYQFIDDENIKR